jgi:hypothetical protein
MFKKPYKKDHKQLGKQKRERNFIFTLKTANEAHYAVSI